MVSPSSTGLRLIATVFTRNGCSRGIQEGGCERRYDAETDNEEWRFGSSVRGPKELWRASTRPNALLASVAAQLNSESFQPVVTWFQKLIVLPSGDIGPGYTMSVSNDEQGKQRVLDLLRDADISVSDIMMRQEEVSLKELKQHLPPRLLQEFADRGRSTVNSVSTSLLHPVAGTGGREPLDLNEESEGTQRMFSFAGVWLEILENNRVAVVDELDLSLHPLLVAALVRRVNSAGAPGADKRAQLVATVHDVTLLGGSSGNRVDRGVSGRHRRGRDQDRRGESRWRCGSACGYESRALSISASARPR